MPMTGKTAPAPRSVEPLLERLDILAQALDRHRRWSLLLDLDGTLAPIVARPDLAHVPESTVACLRALASHPDGFVAIITGRAIDEARALVRLDSLAYAGNHGLEIVSPTGLSFREPTAHALEGRLRSRCDAIARDLAAIPGTQVEQKGLTSSVHYRLAAPDAWETVAACVRAAVPENDPDFTLHDGKCVHEIRPRVAWGKGRAATWLLSQMGRSQDLCFFLGDDVTDEDAFQALAPSGVTARVGPFTQTAARFRIPGPPEVRTFLEWLAQHVGATPAGPP